MKFLIVNADDFGLNRDVNAGVEEAFAAGAVTGATLMVKRKAAGEAIRFALENRDLHVGLHLDLDDILDTGVKGSERFSPQRLESLFRDPALPGRIELEIEEQIAIFKSSSLPLTHLDGHHHLHALPRVFPIVVRKMAEHGIRTVRFSMNLDLVSYPPIKWDSDAFEKMDDLLEKAGIVRTDRLTACPAFEGPEKLDEGVTELMVHPGREEEWRRRDLERIVSPRWKEALEAAGVKLITFRDLSMIRRKCAAG